MGKDTRPLARGSSRKSSVSHQGPSGPESSEDRNPADSIRNSWPQRVSAARSTADPGRLSPSICKWPSANIDWTLSPLSPRTGGHRPRPAARDLVMSDSSGRIADTRLGAPQRAATVVSGPTESALPILIVARRAQTFGILKNRECPTNPPDNRSIPGDGSTLETEAASAWGKRSSQGRTHRWRSFGKRGGCVHNRQKPC